MSTKALRPDALRMSVRTRRASRLTRPSRTRAFAKPHLTSIHRQPVSTKMECSFAITGKDYVIVAADTTSARSIVKMKIDEDKIKTLSPHSLMAYSGEPGAQYTYHIANIE